MVHWKCIGSVSKWRRKGKSKIICGSCYDKMAKLGYQHYTESSICLILMMNVGSVIKWRLSLRLCTKVDLQMRKNVNMKIFMKQHPSIGRRNNIIFFAGRINFKTRCNIRKMCKNCFEKMKLKGRRLINETHMLQPKFNFIIIYWRIVHNGCSLSSTCLVSWIISTKDGLSSRPHCTIIILNSCSLMWYLFLILHEP